MIQVRLTHFPFDANTHFTHIVRFPFSLESCGLCSPDDTTNSQSIYSLTFGAGIDQYSSATTSSFGFSTTYNQQTSGPLGDNAFAFVNSVPGDYIAWNAGALDHTPDDATDGTNGYMMLIAASAIPGEVFRAQIDNLVLGKRYEFSAYVANVVNRGNNLIRPNIRFEVRTASGDDILLASVSSGDIDEYDTLTWNQYGMSFYTPSTSVVLLMISDAPGGDGNDFVVDDITIRTCASPTSGMCGVRKSPMDFSYEVHIPIHGGRD